MNKKELIEYTKYIMLRETLNKLLGINRLLQSILHSDRDLFEQLFIHGDINALKNNYFEEIEKAFFEVGYAIFSSISDSIVMQNSVPLGGINLVGSKVPKNHIGIKAIEHGEIKVAIGKMLMGDLVACASPIEFDNGIVGFVSVGQYINTISTNPVQNSCFIDNIEVNGNVLNGSIKKIIDDYIISTFNKSTLALDYSRPIKLVYSSNEMRELINMLTQVSSSDANVVLEGESGTGKELLARLIHSESDRRNNNFVAINCCAIPDNLLESELFGYEPGSFTGAAKTKIGKFELANDGTLFLDEIGDMSLNLQAKLLRFLEDGVIERLGSLKTEVVNVRVIAATNKNLKNLMQVKMFRPDLYYRLSVITVYVPPLRERKKDIIDLIHYYNDYFCETKYYNKINFTKDALEAFLQGDYEGNVRELKNIIERLLILKGGSLVTADDVIPHISANKLVETDLDKTGMVNLLAQQKEQTEEYIIRKTLADFNGNKTKAAEFLNVSRRTLHNKIKRFDIK